MCRGCRCQYKVAAVRAVFSFHHDLSDFSLTVMHTKSFQRPGWDVYRVGLVRCCMRAGLREGSVAIEKERPERSA